MKGNTMNIDDMTIGQAKQLAAMLGAIASPKLDNKMIGKYVIVRCRDAGVHAGVLESYNGREAVLTESRRLWRFQVPEGSSSFLSGVALDGFGGDARVGGTLPRIHLTETCEIIETTAKAEKSIREWPVCVRAS